MKKKRKSHPLEGVAKPVDDPKFLSEEAMRKFNKKMREVHRETRRKLALSEKSARETIITC